MTKELANMHRLIRCGSVLALALTSLAACAAVPAKSRPAAFEGAWTARLCDKAVSSECGLYSLYLIERDGRICGRHYAATIGLGRLEEGLDDAEPTVVGISGNGQAAVVITSVRNGAKFMGRLTRKGNALLWERVGQIDAGTVDESPVIPAHQELKRDGGRGALATQAELARASCDWIDATSRILSATRGARRQDAKCVSTRYGVCADNVPKSHRPLSAWSGVGGPIPSLAGSPPC